jgi:hypothetical protein
MTHHPDECESVVMPRPEGPIPQKGEFGAYHVRIQKSRALHEYVDRRAYVFSVILRRSDNQRHSPRLDGGSPETGLAEHARTHNAKHPVGRGGFVRGHRGRCPGELPFPVPYHRNRADGGVGPPGRRPPPSVHHLAQPEHSRHGAACHPGISCGTANISISERCRSWDDHIFRMPSSVAARLSASKSS